MKKFIFAIALMCGCLSLSSCEEEIDTTEGIVSTSPARDLAGTYSGTWTKKSGSTVKEFEGTVTIAESDQPYIAKVSVVADLTGDAECLANVVRTDRGSFIQNGSGKLNSKCSAGVSGFVADDNTMTFTFRAQSGFSVSDYSFSGSKN